MAGDGKTGSEVFEIACIGSVLQQRVNKPPMFRVILLVFEGERRAAFVLIEIVGRQVFEVEFTLGFLPEMAVLPSQHLSAVADDARRESRILVRREVEIPRNFDIDSALTGT